MNRATRKPGERYTIWMTRKMPKSVLNKIRVIAAARNVPMWKVHQEALKLGVNALTRKKG